MEFEQMAEQQVAPESPAEQSEASPTTDNQDDGQEQTQEQRPSKKAENRYQKLANSVNQWKQKASEYERQLQKNQEAIQFYETLKQQNPKSLHVLTSMAERMLKQGYDPDQVMAAMEQFQQKQQEDPYSEYDEPIRRLAKEQQATLEELKALKEWKKAQETSVVQQEEEKLHSAFDQMLERDGFVKDGKFDELEVYGLSALTTALAKQFSKTPDRPSLDEVSKAYNLAKQIMNKQGNKAIKNIVNAPSVPASGTIKTVAMPGGKPQAEKPLTPDEMAASWNGRFT